LGELGVYGIIKMDLKENGYEDVEWIHLAQIKDQ
jgi:hypothetical protein